MTQLDQLIVDSYQKYCSLIDLPLRFWFSRRFCSASRLFGIEDVDETAEICLGVRVVVSLPYIIESLLHEVFLFSNSSNVIL